MIAVDTFIDTLEADVRRANILSADSLGNMNAMIYDMASDSLIRTRDLLPGAMEQLSEWDCVEQTGRLHRRARK